MADLEKQNPKDGKHAKIDDPLHPPRRHHRSCCRSCSIVLLKVLISVALIIGVPLALFFIIVNPQKMKVTVSEASLNRFELRGTNNTDFRYSLQLNITIRNPNRIMAFYYRNFNSWLYYTKPMEIESRWSSSGFTQRRKSTMVQRLSFGRNFTLVPEYDSAIASQFNRERSRGVFSFDLKLEPWVKVKFGKIKIGTFVPKVDCEQLKIPLVADRNRNPSLVFKPTRCHVEFKATSILDIGFERCKSCS